MMDPGCRLDGAARVVQAAKESPAGNSRGVTRHAARVVKCLLSRRQVDLSGLGKEGISRA